MAIQREIWQQHIIEEMYAANPHLSFCFNADQYVLQGKVVHIPQAGASPGVTKNRSNLPAAVTRRQDVDITYAIDEFTTDPVHIPNADKAELSYDKRASVLTDTQLAVNEVVGVNMFFNWAPSGDRVIKTSGDAVPAHLNGATGNRKKVALADLKKAQKQMNKDNVPTDGRYAIFDADMYDQLTDQLTESQYRDFSRAYDEKNGIVGKLFGFNILQRSFVLRYTPAGNPRTPEAATDATDRAGALCWHQSSVERALGDTTFFEDEGNPQYYGDIYSALVRMGGRIRRKDGKGVIAIVQDEA